MGARVHLTVDDDQTAAVALGAGAILALAAGLTLDSRMLRMLGLAAAVTGGGLYVRGKLTERAEKIETTETQIRSELDELDPVARAQVLKGLAESDSDS